MFDNDAQQRLFYRIAIAATKGVNAEVAIRLEERGISHRDFFDLPSHRLAEALGLNRRRLIDSESRHDAYVRARAELDFVERHGITVSYITDSDYPKQLREMSDAPVALFILGRLDTDAGHTLAIVGTRNATPYGTGFCRTLVEAVATDAPDTWIISGLAYGIDGEAHRQALANGLPTAAVVAHGLGMVYPASHRGLAAQIVREGGAIVSAYLHDERPYRGRFLERNRVIAGLSDAVMVVESDIKGGAMSTAAAAFDADREVFALPGRASDMSSAGCNLLIRRQKAELITSPDELLKSMGWCVSKQREDPKQHNLPLFDDPSASLVYDVLRTTYDPAGIDQLCAGTGLPANELLAILTELEFDGHIIRYPGNRYALAPR